MNGEISWQNLHDKKTPKCWIDACLSIILVTRQFGASLN